MESTKRTYDLKLLQFIVVMTGFFLYESQLFGATVDICYQKSMRCILKLEKNEAAHLKVGAYAQVVNEFVRPVAIGRVIKTKGQFAVVSVHQLFKLVEPGNPVLLEKNQTFDDKSVKEKSSKYVPRSAIAVRF